MHSNWGRRNIFKLQHINRAAIVIIYKNKLINKPLYLLMGTTQIRYCHAHIGKVYKHVILWYNKSGGNRDYSYLFTEISEWVFRK